MIVLRSAEPLPLLGAAKIAHQPSVEVGDASPECPNGFSPKYRQK